MEILTTAHLIFLAAWGGLVLCEMIVEMTSRDPISKKQASVQHFWMDVLIEIPLLLGVLLTGGAMIHQAMPLETAMMIKLACALGAIGINFTCAVWVIQRYRNREDEAAVMRYSRKIRLAGAAVPLALIAAYIGFSHYYG